MCRTIYRKTYFSAVVRLLVNSGRIDRSIKENLKTAKKGEEGSAENDEESRIITRVEEEQMEQNNGRRTRSSRADEGAD